MGFGIWPLVTLPLCEESPIKNLLPSFHNLSDNCNLAVVMPISPLAKKPFHFFCNYWHFMLSTGFMCHKVLNLLFCPDYFFLVKTAFKNLLKFLWHTERVMGLSLCCKYTWVGTLTFNALTLLFKS